MLCMPGTSSSESVNKSLPPLLFSSTSSPTYAPTPPSPSTSTNSRTSFHNTSSQHDEALSPELFSPTPTSSTIQNKWPSLPPPSPSPSPPPHTHTHTALFQWCTRNRKRHNLHIYASLALTSRSYNVCSNVCAPSTDTLISLLQIYMTCLPHSMCNRGSYIFQHSQFAVDHFYWCRH